MIADVPAELAIVAQNRKPRHHAGLGHFWRLEHCLTPPRKRPAKSERWQVVGMGCSKWNRQPCKSCNQIRPIKLSQRLTIPKRTIWIGIAKHVRDRLSLHFVERLISVWLTMEKRRCPLFLTAIGRSVRRASIGLESEELEVQTIPKLKSTKTKTSADNASVRHGAEVHTIMITTAAIGRNGGCSDRALRCLNEIELHVDAVPFFLCHDMH